MWGYMVVLAAASEPHSSSSSMASSLASNPRSEWSAATLCTASRKRNTAISRRQNAAADFPAGICLQLREPAAEREQIALIESAFRRISTSVVGLQGNERRWAFSPHFQGLVAENLDARFDLRRIMRREASYRKWSSCIFFPGDACRRG